MKAKDMIIDFINVVFVIVIITSAIFYFLVGDNFEQFKNIIEALSPVAVFLLIMMIAVKLRRLKGNKREKEGNTEVTLNLSYSDKINGDLISFLIPVVMLLTPFFMNGEINLADFIQALFAFAIVALWNKYLFDQEDL